MVFRPIGVRFHIIDWELRFSFWIPCDRSSNYLDVDIVGKYYVNIEY